MAFKLKLQMCEASLLCGKNAEARKFSAEEKHLVLCGGGDYFHGHKKAFDQATVQSDKQNYFMARRLEVKREGEMLCMASDIMHLPPCTVIQ